MGRSKSIPYIRITGAWLGPTPRRKRPSHAALAVAPCWAITSGCRGQVGTTATPRESVVVDAPARARAMIGSNPKAAPSHIPWNPWASVLHRQGADRVDAARLGEQQRDPHERPPASTLGEPRGPAR